MIGGEEESDLAAKAGARFRIVQEIGDAGNEVGAIKILDDRKHVHVDVFGLQKRHDLIVHGVNALAMNHVKHGVRFRIDSFEMTIRVENLQPGRKQQINLARVLAQG